MSHFNESGVEDGSLFGIHVEGSYFSLGGGGHDTFNHFGDVDNGAMMGLLGRFPM